MRDIERQSIVRIGLQRRIESEDDVVVEEPLEIRVNNKSLVVTMRTPSHDDDLAVGLLWTEGVIQSIADVGAIAYCANEEFPELRNVLNVTLVDSQKPAPTMRSTWSSSSCGLCGKATIDAIRRSAQPVQSDLTMNYRVLATLPDLMRERQANFDRTGGIHAAGLFDASGNLLLIREDLGRHNAVDKVLGAALRQGVRWDESTLMISGRLGFEIAQKAVVAGIPIIASVSAPSSLAIDLAKEFGVTAVGFVRDGSMNIYSHPQRIIHAVSEHSA